MSSDYQSENTAPTMTFASPLADGGIPNRVPADEPTFVTEKTMATEAQATMPATLGRIDQYELVRKLGGGGFGVVYLAHDTISGVDVALKTLHPLLKGNAEEMERLREKFVLVSRLSHPNIATALVLHPVREVAICDEDARNEMRISRGDPVMVMRYAPGETLAKWRRQFTDGIVPFPLVIEVGRQIAVALDYAHGERIVHRDIKPANVMVETLSTGVSKTASSQAIRIRLLDFGLAAEIRSSMSRVSCMTGETSGTRPYMAPEQWLGRKQDGRTDQYALACVLYALISGSPPFSNVFGIGDSAVIANVVQTQTPAEISGVPAHVNAAFQKALSKDPQNRFASCAAFVEALEGHSGSTFRIPWLIPRALSRKRGLLLIAVSVVAVMAFLLLRSAGRRGNSRVSDTPPVTQVSDTPPVTQVSDTPPVTQVSDTPPVTQVSDTPARQVSDTSPVLQVSDTPPIPQVSDTPPIRQVSGTPPVTQVSDTPPAPQAPDIAHVQPVHGSLTLEEKTNMVSKAIDMMRNDQAFLLVYSAKKSKSAKNAPAEGGRRPSIAMDYLRNRTRNNVSSSRELGLVARYLHDELDNTGLFDVMDDFVSEEMLDKYRDGNHVEVTAEEQVPLRVPDFWLTGELRLYTDGDSNTYFLNLELKDPVTKKVLWRSSVERRK